MRVVLIGTGNVATILGKKISRTGNSIVQVYGRNPGHAERLARELSATHCSLFKEIDLTADLYLIAVSDAAVQEVVKLFHPGDKLVVHTAGSVPMNVLAACSSSYGILYPLQSLRRELDPATEIPLLIDASDEAARQVLRDFAKKLSDKVEMADDGQRMKLHLAAVIASNFSNHLYMLSEDYCKKEGLDFGLLHPLILETARRLQHASPAVLQTGPASRGDESTIRRHLELLKSYPSLYAVYNLLTRSIEEKR